MDANERFLGIDHRVKETAEGKARPTLLAINSGLVTKLMELETEQSELDFVLGICPTGWITIMDTHVPQGTKKHHILATKTEGEVQVPKDYEGLRPRDTVAMVLGGSGDCLAFALAKQAEKIGARIVRIPPFLLKKERGAESKENDAELLTRLAQAKPQLFTEVTLRDRKTILVRENLRVRSDAMKARIACEQRLRQRAIGAIFCQPDGIFPEGGIEKYFDTLKASDVILGALESEETSANKTLEKSVKATDVWQKVLSEIEGCGPAIASRLIATIMDIRRFETDAQLKKFLGVAVMSDGTFPRRKAGQVANWNPDGRQALYLLADQFNRRPNSVWGRKLLEYKAKLRVAHPEPVEIDGKKRYTNGHIHKMALWKTVTKFVESLHREWWKLEEAQAEIQKAS